MWLLITNVQGDPAQATRKWADRDVAMKGWDEGWSIDGSYPNCLSKKVGLDDYGYGLIRTIQ